MLPVIRRGGCSLTGASKFIVLEGIDGSGKTSVAKHLCSSLGRTAVYTSEPYDPVFQRRVEGIIHRDDSDSIAAKALLYTADRADQTRRIAEWLAAHRNVICDRYYMSTIAYQSAELKGRDLKMAGWLREINRPFLDLPDAVIYLDSDPGNALKRIGGRASKLKLYERRDFLEDVRKSYLSELRRFAGKKYVISADVQLKVLKEEVMSVVTRVIGGE